MAIPAGAGIPVTHRGLSRSFHVITGHTAHTPDGLPENFAALARCGGTLVFLMGLGHLEVIARRLMEEGRAPDTPVAVVSGGNSAHPADVRGTLADIARLARDVQAPAVIVVGAVAALRLRLAIPLRRLLLVFYCIVFLLAALAPGDFIPVSFDSGGVTTGPITVPFIMALGLGIASTRSDANSASDSFGLISLCSIGPILAVLLLGICYRPESAGYSMTQLPELATTADAARCFRDAFPSYFKEEMMLN